MLVWHLWQCKTCNASKIREKHSQFIYNKSTTSIYGYQGCHFPDNMKLSDFSLTFPDQDPWVRDHLGWSGGIIPQKIFKIRIFSLAENEFQTTKFPDFSLTFGILSQILWLFRQIPWLSEVSFKFPDFPGFPGQWQLISDSTKFLHSDLIGKMPHSSALQLYLVIWGKKGSRWRSGQRVSLSNQLKQGLLPGSG